MAKLKKAAYPLTSFTACGSQFNMVIDNHSISSVTHGAYVANFTNPALPPNTGLTAAILSIINDDANLCEWFIHFGANPFNTTTNNDIVVAPSATASGLFKVNYSVALFRALVTAVPGCQFHFNKAKTETGAFDIIFKVVSGGFPVFWANISSGVPFM